MIKYEAYSNMGLIRSNNEDNLFLNGEYLPMIHGNLEKCCGQTHEGTFAVFDGLGGEQQGEAASYLAAETLSKHKDYGHTEVSILMNDEICRYTKENKLDFCGSTSTIITVRGDTATCSNVGDSRIYLLRDGKLKQLSKDHSLTIMGRKKLMQCLGIPESEFIICPHTEHVPIMTGDRFLICSDGVTDMVSDQELCQLLQKDNALDELEQLILERGAVDNYTGILLEYL